MNKLKPKDVPVYRRKKLNEQRNICALCGKKIAAKDATLDHDHATGYCRTVLHRTCNSVEGRVLHWARRSGTSPAQFLSNLLSYWAVDYSNNPIHPNHRTDKDKQATGIRRRIRKAKRPSTKARLKQELRELLE